MCTLPMAILCSRQYYYTSPKFLTLIYNSYTFTSFDAVSFTNYQTHIFNFTCGQLLSIGLGKTNMISMEPLSLSKSINMINSLNVHRCYYIPTRLHHRHFVRGKCYSNIRMAMSLQRRPAQVVSPSNAGIRRSIQIFLRPR